MTGFWRAMLLLEVACVLAGCAGRSPNQTPIAVTASDGSTYSISALRIGVYPLMIRSGENAIWILDSRGGFWRINPQNCKAEQLPLKIDEPVDFVVGHGSIWVSSYPPLGLKAKLRRFDAHTFQQTAAIDTGGSLGVDEQAIWVFDRRAGTLERVSPQSDSIIRTIAVKKGERRILTHGSDLWLLGCDDGALTKIDTVANRVEWSMQTGPEHKRGLERVVIGGDTGFYSGLAVAGDIAWITDHHGTSRIFDFSQPEAALLRIDLSKREVTDTLAIARWPLSPVVFSGWLWISVVENQRMRILKLDAQTGQRLESIGMPIDKMYLPETGETMAAGQDALWIGADRYVQRLEFPTPQQAP
jgi:hypothetical protein